MLYENMDSSVSYRHNEMPVTGIQYQRPKQNVSAAEKLYMLINMDHSLDSNLVKRFWNLENRVYAVKKFVGLMYDLQDKIVTKNNDLEVLLDCIHSLETKTGSKHWQKVLNNNKRGLEQQDIDEATSSIKDYIVKNYRDALN